MAIINPNEQAIGWLVNTPQTSSSVAINAAATFVALGFVPRYGKTINEIRLLCVTKTGTVTAGNITGSIYSDTPGTGPNAQIDINTNSPSYATGTFFDFTGYTTAASAGQQLWLVLKNLQGTPASNNISVLTTSGSGALPNEIGANTKYGWGRVTSTDSGATWSGSPVAQSSFLRIKYSDGSYEGLPIKSISTSSSSVGIYGASEMGAMFTLRSTWPTVNVTGLRMPLRSITGTPTGNLRLRLYSGSSSTPTRLGTTHTIPVGAVNSNAASWFTGYFSTPIAVAANTLLHVVAGTDGSDSGSNRFNGADYVFDSDSNSVLLMPLGAVQTYSTDGTNFTQNANTLTPFGLILDASGGEFTVSGGSGGVVAPTAILGGESIQIAA